MMKSTLIAAVLLGASSLAPAQGLVAMAHVQRVLLEPKGTDNCKPLCPAMVTTLPDGNTRVCVVHDGGCQTMDLRIDQVWQGAASEGETRSFRSRIGEFGPSYHAVSVPVVVTEEAGAMHWAPIIEQDGKQRIDPRKLWKFNGVLASSPGDGELVELDEVLARIGVRR